MPKERVKCDLLIIGAGIIGISIGIAYLNANPGKKVISVDKENEIGKHATGRNSGVLHAGFYYSSESLKAKFCREGNIQLHKIAKKYGVPIREFGKVVVSRNIEEDSRLDLLFKRGLQNGVELELLDESLLKKYEPLARTTNRFLWSPTTAVSDPQKIIRALQTEFQSLGGRIDFDTKIKLVVTSGMVRTLNDTYEAEFIVNAAGGQADRISRQINVGLEYAMLPFMGVYRVTDRSELPLQRLVYPVPHPVNPFLGVHFTLTVDGLVKIGPTAIPLFGREQYSFREGWSLSDSIQAIKGSVALMRGESHNFGAILKSEWPKIVLKQLVRESTELVSGARDVKRWEKKPPGIRAQLVHLPSGKLEQDFVVKQYLNSVHVLNAVSPGWTSALPFGKWIVEEYLTRRASGVI
ncbi:aminobutyraldehyde dehydrogenase [Actinomycetes bacterium]|nr:aminobutyraldehyde dehydrogenase [Actinomycetes bacterium]